MQEEPAETVQKALANWRSASNVPITIEQWDFCCSQMKALSTNYRLRRIHFKFLNSLYCTPTQLHKMGLLDSARCRRCGRDVADFEHLAWSCPDVADYWTQAMDAIDAILDVHLDRSHPLVALLDYV